MFITKERCAKRDAKGTHARVACLCRHLMLQIFARPHVKSNFASTTPYSRSGDAGGRAGGWSTLLEASLRCGCCACYPASRPLTPTPFSTPNPQAPNQPPHGWGPSHPLPFALHRDPRRSTEIVHGHHHGDPWKPRGLRVRGVCAQASAYAT